MIFPKNAAMDSVAVSWHLGNQETSSVETKVKVVNMSFSGSSEEEMQIQHLSNVLHFLSIQPFALKCFSWNYFFTGLS